MSLQLSISLLASRRPESLERCLDSLRPLLMQVPSELIIVSTGTDKTVHEIARRYTDQILHFEWCGDFSAARNAGLKAARGEWFLYMDDDEWFEDISEIRDFFLSGEYRGFGSASYIQRNYTDWSGTSCIDYRVFRMNRIVPGSSFQNPIHEELFPRLEPCKSLDVYVHHYGYVSNKSGCLELKEKNSRNIPMLLKDIEEHPSNIKNYLQLIQEYTSAKDWAHAEKYCQKARSLCRGINAYEGWVQANLASILFEKGNDKKTRHEISQMLKKENPCELVRLIFYNILVKISFRQNDFKETLHFGLEFEQLLNCMEETPELWKQQQYGTLNRQKIINPERLSSIRICCIRAALELDEPEQAGYFLRLLPWNEEYQIQSCYPLFDEWKETYAPLFPKLLKSLPLDSTYLSLQRISAMEDDTSKRELLTAYAESTKNIYLQLQVVKKAFQMKADFSFIADTMDLDTWKQCTKEFLKALSSSDVDAFWTLSAQLRDTHPLQGLWLFMLLLERKLTHGQYFLHELESLLDEYCKTINSFYKEQYHKSMFSDRNKHLLPKDYQFASLAYASLEKIKQKNFPEAIRLLRSSLSFKPEMTGAVNEVIRQMKNQADDPSRDAAGEYQSLAIQLKQAVSSLINQGMYQEAFSTLPQLTALLPADLELLRIKQNLLRSMACPRYQSRLCPDKL